MCKNGSLCFNIVSKSMHTAEIEVNILQNWVKSLDDVTSVTDRQREEI